MRGKEIEFWMRSSLPHRASMGNRDRIRMLLEGSWVTSSRPVKSGRHRPAGHTVSSPPPSPPPFTDTMNGKQSRHSS